LTQDCFFKQFQHRIIDWYQQEGREFYWRTTNLNPWQWLFLELLLIRTKAETVETVIHSLLEKYFNPQVVVQTNSLDLENDLKYLGLYRQRSSALKQIAKSIITKHNGAVPLEQSSLAALPHVGLYISNAVLCFCHGKRRPIVDSNIARVLTRYHGLDLPNDVREKWLWDLAEEMLPDEKWLEYNFGLLDFGAKVCKKRKPKCILCCLRDVCKFTNKFV